MPPFTASIQLPRNSTDIHPQPRFFGQLFSHRPQAIFRTPTSAAVVLSDIEALVIHVGGQVLEREGSRVRLVLGDVQWRCHQPHQGKEAKKYQVKKAREFLQRAGIEP